MATPLCPDCKKQMTVRYICQHCGYDDQRLQTATNRKVAPMPFECVRDGKPTAKRIEGIPVCGDCFVEGWGRLPDMPLEEPHTGVLARMPLRKGEERLWEAHTKLIDDNITTGSKDFPCPSCKRKFGTKSGLGIHKKSKHGGK